MERRKAIGWAARDESAILSPYSYHLRKTGAEDILFRVLYCGMDHTDLHNMKNEIHSTNYPLVPGHEVVGQVVELGSEVKAFAIGDIVGVGCIISSCGECYACQSNLEQYCNKVVWTYNDIYTDGSPTQGGFSSAMVVHQKFVVKIPKTLAPEQAAPLLCAGVTAYSPLKGLVGSGKELNVGILGLGGVGHLGVLIAKAMGHHVTVISSSDKKMDEPLEHLGADSFLVSSNAAEMEAAAGTIDCILDTVPAAHDLQHYLSLLKLAGKIFIVGAAPKPLQFGAPKPLQFGASGLILGKKTITGSFIGSIKETQELLDFWVEKDLKTMIELVKMDYVNTAFLRMERNDVRYRFVLDVAGSNLELED